MRGKVKWRSVQVFPLKIRIYLLIGELLVILLDQSGTIWMIKKMFDTQILLQNYITDHLRTIDSRHVSNKP